MLNEDKLRLDQARGTQAENLLANELLREAFSELEQAYIAKWRETTIHDVVAREKLFLAVNVIGKVKDHLVTIVANGTLAKRELDDLAKLAEPRKRFGIV